MLSKLPDCLCWNQLGMVVICLISSAKSKRIKFGFFFKVFGMSLLIIGGCGRDIKLSVEVP